MMWLSGWLGREMAETSELSQVEQFSITHGWTDRQTHGQVDRQPDRQTDRHTAT